MRNLLLAAAAFALLAPATATAQPAASPPAIAPAPAPSPSHMAAAHELLGVIRMDEAAMAGLMVSLEQQVRVNPSLGEFRGVMEEWGWSVFTSEAAREAFAALYAEEFSEGDLRELAAFFRTPVGQRLAERQGRLAMRGAEVGERLATERQADLEARLEEHARKHEP